MIEILDASHSLVGFINGRHGIADEIDYSCVW